MEQDLKVVTINGKEYRQVGDYDIRKDMAPCDNYWIVRTQSAGVFAGEIIHRANKEVTLQNARRIWYWAGAASLSQLAMEGTSKPQECKFPCEVAEIVLTEAIELIRCTERARRIISEVPVWAA